MQDAADRPHWKRTLAVLGVMAASFAFQETGVLPVLPVIQRQLPGASTTSSALLESGFLIVAAVAAPLIGKFGDTHGKQRMLRPHSRSRSASARCSRPSELRWR